MQKLRKRKYVLMDNKSLYLLMLPGLLYFVIFKLLPMWGVVLSFQDYSIYKGFWGSDWVGFKHFTRLLTYDKFWLVFKNSIILSTASIIIGFPVSIILALMLNEMYKVKLKKLMQTMMYLPHFISWVIVVSLTHMIFGLNGGFVNEIIVKFGGKPIPFAMSSEYFRQIIVGQSIWKSAGWGTIIYLAALAGIHPALYEAAHIDGANRLQKIIYITLPSLKGTIITVMILSLGKMLDLSFEQVYNMLNPLVMDVGDTLETYVYRQGIISGEFSFSTAVGVFKSAISVTLILSANRLAKYMGEQGII